MFLNLLLKLSRPLFFILWISDIIRASEVSSILLKISYITSIGAVYIKGPNVCKVESIVAIDYIFFHMWIDALRKNIQIMKINIVTTFARRKTSYMNSILRACRMNSSSITSLGRVSSYIFSLTLYFVTNYAYISLCCTAHVKFFFLNLHCVVTIVCFNDTFHGCIQVRISRRLCVHLQVSRLYQLFSTHSLIP